MQTLPAGGQGVIVQSVKQAPRVSPWTATVVLGLGALVSHGFGLSLVPALLPQIEDTFDSGFGPLGFAVATGLAAYAAGGLSASRILEWLPNRTVLNGTFLLTALSLAVASLAASPLLIALSATLLGIAAPISWTATTHVATRSVARHSRSLVMGGASAGVGLGVIVNGFLVQVFSGPGTWRTGFVVAAIISVLVTISTMLVFRQPIDRPSTGSDVVARRGSYRAVFGDWPGKVVVLSSAIAGVGAYTFVTFLTTTAIVEMGVSASAAGGLLLMMGGVGVIASLSLGRFGDRGSPVRVVSTIFLICGVGLSFLSVFWGYPGLVIASLGIAVLNYPVWGLVAAIAARRFDPPLALRAVSLGLVGAATLSSVGSIAAGQWLDHVGSMRVPILVLTAMMLVVGVWLARNYRVHVID